MLTIRHIYDSKQKNYLHNLYEQFGTIPDNHMKAIKLRQEFFTKFVLDRTTVDYQTNVEKDWSYIARREYKSDVLFRSFCDGFGAGLAACIIRMFMVKKFIVWPLAPVWALVTIYRQQDLYLFYNKKFFDMCNVGEQYEIGRERNKVLQQCNKLLGVEDF